jgi:hypothetical protein
LEHIEEPGWKDVDLVQGPSGKTEMVIENLENLSDGTTF